MRARDDADSGFSKGKSDYAGGGESKFNGGKGKNGLGGNRSNTMPAPANFQQTKFVSPNKTNISPNLTAAPKVTEQNAFSATFADRAIRSLMGSNPFSGKPTPNFNVEDAKKTPLGKSILDGTRRYYDDRKGGGGASNGQPPAGSGAVHYNQKYNTYVSRTPEAQKNLMDGVTSYNDRSLWERVLGTVGLGQVDPVTDPNFNPAVHNKPQTSFDALGMGLGLAGMATGMPLGMAYGAGKAAYGMATGTNPTFGEVNFGDFGEAEQTGYGSVDGRRVSSQTDPNEGAFGGFFGGGGTGAGGSSGSGGAGFQGNPNGAGMPGNGEMYRAKDKGQASRAISAGAANGNYDPNSGDSGATGSSLLDPEAEYSGLRLKDRRKPYLSASDYLGI